MKVKQLKEMLSKCNSEKEVKFYDTNTQERGYWYELTFVSVEEHEEEVSIELEC